MISCGSLLPVELRRIGLPVSGSFQQRFSIMRIEQIDALIRDRIDIAELDVRSDDGVHFSALVVSPQFEGLRQLQRHQLVYSALGERMGGEIHALSIRALTPAEYQGAEA